MAVRYVPAPAGTSPLPQAASMLHLSASCARSTPFLAQLSNPRTDRGCRGLGQSVKLGQWRVPARRQDAAETLWTIPCYANVAPGHLYRCPALNRAIPSKSVLDFLKSFVAIRTNHGTTNRSAKHKLIDGSTTPHKQEPSSASPR